MIAGLAFLMSSTSMLNRCLASGRKLVRNTSDRLASSYAICWPSGLETSRPIERLPRLACSKLGLGSPVTLYAPTWRRPRWGSPVTPSSTLITSAPQSDRPAPADGTKPYIATSRTRMPSSGPAIRPPPSPGRCGRGVPPSGHHRRQGLALEEFLEAGGAHPAADAGLLVAAERDVGAEPHPAVDADRAGSDPPGDAEGALVVGAVDRAGQAVDRVVGDPDRVVVAVVVDDHQHRAERLLLGDLAVRVEVGEQGRGVVVAGIDLGAAGDEGGAGRDRPLDQAVDLVPLPRADQRAHVVTWVGRVAVRDRAEHGRDLGDDLVMARPGHHHPGRDRAPLAGVRAGRERAHHGGLGEVGVVQHDQGGLAAELEEDPLDGA